MTEPTSVTEVRKLREQFHPFCKDSLGWNFETPVGSLHWKIYELALKYKPKKYGEIGSGIGVSASCVAYPSPETHLYLYDSPGHGYGGFGGSDEYLIHHMTKFAKGRCTLNLGDSQTQTAKDMIISNGPYDMFNIDGDHSYIGAKSDYDTVKKCLAEKSILIIDDITHIAHKEDLTRLFNEALEEIKSIHKNVRSEVIEEGTGVGIIYINID